MLNNINNRKWKQKGWQHGVNVIRERKYKFVAYFQTYKIKNYETLLHKSINSTRMRRFIEEKSNRNMLTRILVTLNNRKDKTFELPEQQRMFQEIKQIISKK